MKTLTPDISIIVPVYNAEKYLHRCVDSILAQTFTNFELILVDDGSPDGSGAICDKYAKNDNRVKVIHKENGGVASARQCGIDNATGEYTIHADPDDWVEPNMLQELYNKAKETDADMVICDFYVDTENECVYRTQNVSSITSSVVLKDLLFHRLHGSLWNKLIRLACYTENNIKFIKDLNYFEDYLVCLKILMHDIKIAYLDQAFYHYDQIANNDSITRTFSVKTLEQQKMFVTNLETLIPEKEEIIVSNKLRIKFSVFEANMPKVFNSLYPEVNNSIWKFNTSIVNRILFSLATIGMFCIAHKLYNLKTKKTI